MRSILAILIPLLAQPFWGAAAEHPQQSPLPLAGLWALQLAGEATYPSSAGLSSFYPSGDPQVPANQAFGGAEVSLRCHLADRFYLGAGVAATGRSYSVQEASGQGTLYLDTLYYHGLLGWVWHRGARSYGYLQAEAGWVALNQASYASASGKDDGVLEGGAFASGAGLGVVWMLIPSVGLSLEGGYRGARIGSVSYSKSAGDHVVDGSGPYARAGLNFYMGLKDPWGDFGPQPALPPPPPSY